MQWGSRRLRGTEKNVSYQSNMMAFVPKGCMFQKSGAASTLPSKKYLTQSFIEGPVGVKKLAWCGGVEEENSKIASSPVNNLLRKASG